MKEYGIILIAKLGILVQNVLTVVHIKKDKNMKQDKYPCDNCSPLHMCGHCTLCEEWEKIHPKNEIETKEKYNWK